VNAVARKSVARLRQALHRAAHTGRQLLTAALATSAATLIRRAGATLTGFTAAQLASAAELIEDNGIHLLRGRIWLTVSTDGSRVHRTTTHACSCEAGIKGRSCYHQLAARVLEVE
jgi:hypothetical protein